MKQKLSFKQYLKSFFIESTDQPVSEIENKWYYVSFYATFCLLFMLVCPLLFLAGEWRNAVKLSLYWFALLGGLVGWPLSWIFTLKYWFRISHNFGLFMYEAHLRDRERKKLKEGVK